MKIGIITFHFAYNPGAVLQCYALQTYLKKMGCSVEIINYRPWYHQNSYTLFRNPLQAAKDEYAKYAKRNMKGQARFHAVYSFLATIKSWTKCYEVIKCNRLYVKFVRENFSETKCYRTLKKLKADPPKCEVYLSGSDQVWNPELTGGNYDYAYFLDFGSRAVKKVSYAIGMTAFPEGNLRALNCLSEFKVISMREEDSFCEVARRFGEKAFLDVDPTLLLCKSDYDSMISNMILEEKPFIVNYVLPDVSGKLVIEKANHLAKKMGVRSISICGKAYEEMYEKSNVQCCGPKEFIWYIANAEYVLTNSFHAVIFSIIFHKKFLSALHMNTGNRVKHLLKMLGLQGRILAEQTDETTAMEEPIEYEQIDKLIGVYRNKSQKHLKKWIFE